jgi:hypothetical protein
MFHEVGQAVVLGPLVAASGSYGHAAMLGYASRPMMHHHSKPRWQSGVMIFVLSSVHEIAKLWIFALMAKSM